MWPVIIIKMVGRKVVRIRLKSLLCITNCKQTGPCHICNFVTISAIGIGIYIDLDSNQVTGLSPELCVPDVVLGKFKRPLIFKHIWH